jgi:hypothetical protein
MRHVIFLLAAIVWLSAGPVDRPAFAQVGGFAARQADDFERRRACEQNLPTCRPQDRRQMEEERRNNMWLSIMIGGVLVLVGLVMVRETKRKKREQDQVIARGRQAARDRRKKEDPPNPDYDDFGGSGLGRSTVDRPGGFGR